MSKHRTGAGYRTERRPSSSNRSGTVRGRIAPPAPNSKGHAAPNVRKTPRVIHLAQIRPSVPYATTEEQESRTPTGTSGNNRGQGPPTRTTREEQEKEPPTRHGRPASHKNQYLQHHRRWSPPLEPTSSPARGLKLGNKHVFPEVIFYQLFYCSLQSIVYKICVKARNHALKLITATPTCPPPPVLDWFRNT